MTPIRLGVNTIHWDIPCIKNCKIICEKPGPGIEIAITTLQILNLNVCVVPATENKWGSFENGSWNGLVGDILDDKIDLTLSYLYASTERSKAVDFIPLRIFEGSYCFIMHRNALQYRHTFEWWTIYPWTFWAIFVVTTYFKRVFIAGRKTFIVSLIIYAIALSCFRLVTKSRLVPKLVRRHEPPFKNYDQAAEKIASGEFFLGVLDSTAYEKTLLQDKRFTSMQDAVKINPPIFTNMQNGFELITMNSKVFLFATEYECNAMKIHSLSIHCHFISKKEMFFSTSMLPYNSTLKRNLTSSFEYMQENALISMTLQKYGWKIENSIIVDQIRVKSITKNQLIRTIVGYFISICGMVVSLIIENIVWCVKVLKYE